VIGAPKPYPAYKDSGAEWLGDIPADWNVLPGRACYRERHVPNLGLVETSVLSLSFGRIVVKPEEKLHGLVPSSFETYQIIDPGDIIVRPTDLQNDWNSLRFGLSTHRGIITSAYMCLRTTDVMTREFGHLLLHAYDLKKVFYGLGSGLRQNLDWRDFKYLPCVVPPLDEQAAIVRHVNHVNRRVRQFIRDKQKQIRLLEEQKQATINRAVTCGLDPGVRHKPSGVESLGDVPEHWDVRRLKDVAVVQTGLTLGKDYRGATTESYPYLRVANVQLGHADLTHVKYVDVPPGEAAGATLRAGDVLMTEGGDIDKLGRGCVWKGEIPNCLYQNHVFAVRCNLDVLAPEFLVGLMTSQHGRAFFQTTAKQTTNLASTNSTTLRTFPVALPPIGEQRAILDELARRTSRIDAVVARTENEARLLHEYRTCLTAGVAMGKTHVREAADSLLADDDELEFVDGEDVCTGRAEADDIGEVEVDLDAVEA